jgi:hypothetical protein
MALARNSGSNHMPFAEYLDAKETNRKAFAEAYPAVIDAFEVSVRAFSALGEQLRTGRDFNNKTHVSLAPFFLILQRQSMVAYDVISTRQAYQAWVSIRTGIESALIIGKWVDDKSNADIWENRFEDPKPYRKVYQGSGLESKALPNSGSIRSALSHINDLFLHPNPRYYYRHLSMKDLPDKMISLEIDFFDTEDEVSLAILGVLHLVAYVQDSLAAMFASLFIDMAKLDVGLLDFESKAAGWRSDLGRKHSNLEWSLVNLGLWPAAI